MQDDTNKKEDIYGLSEIEKIQAEIARDLELADSLQLPPSQPPKEEPQNTDALWRVPPPVPVPPKPYVPPRPVRQVSWLKRLVTVCIVCTLGTATFGFAFGAASAWMSQRGQETAVGSMPGETPGTVHTNRYAFDIVSDGSVATLADMIDLVSASVVSITAFTDPDINTGIQMRAPRRNGTGVIFGEDNERVYIVTSHYVVDSGNRVFVRFSCGANIAAHPFAHDIDINISVIALLKTDLEAQGVENVVLAIFGDSSAMRMGDTVVALGNARGEGISVTRGIISTEEQFMQIPRGPRMMELYLIQTDASINYGDSGGPLLNARGEVIGIIDASITFADTSALVEGIGHCVSSNTVQRLLYQLINRLRPAIGISGRDLPSQRAEELGIPDIGVEVDRTMEGGAAEKAGILGGDIITGFNGRPVLDMDQLRAEIAQLHPGDVVEVRILRDGEAMVLELTLQAMIFDTF
jgi:serine protease Do